MRDVMDSREAFEKCEELFERYGISEEDQGWCILAFESLCIHGLIMKKGPFYERYTTALAEHALEDAQLEVLIQHELDELAKDTAEIEAIIEARRKEKEPSASEAVTQQQRWQLKLREMGELCDALGKPVDAGIRETVAILQLLGLHTRQSCEGHIGRGLPAPWVALYVPEAEQLREKIISLEEWLEAHGEGTEEFERVGHEAHRLRQEEAQYEAQAWMLLFPWLETYYQRHSAVPCEERIVLHANGRLTIQGALLQGARDPATQARKLQAYQSELRRFTQFLKRQFLRNRF